MLYLATKMILIIKISYFTTIQIKLMVVSGTINNLCFLFTLINKLKYFNVTHLPLFTPISLTNILELANSHVTFMEVDCNFLTLEVAPNFGTCCLALENRFSVDHFIIGLVIFKWN